MPWSCWVGNGMPVPTTYFGIKRFWYKPLKFYFYCNDIYVVFTLSYPHHHFLTENKIWNCFVEGQSPICCAGTIYLVMKRPWLPVLHDSTNSIKPASCPSLYFPSHTFISWVSWRKFGIFLMCTLSFLYRSLLSKQNTVWGFIVL